MLHLDQLGKSLIFFDGGMGSLLQAKGLGPGEAPESWNILHPDIIEEIHRDYVEAGAHVVTANSFGANDIRMSRMGLDAGQVITQAVSIAKRAAQGRALVALDMGPSGKLLAPLGDLPFENAVSLFVEQAAAGERAGADFIIIETMTDTYELKAAVLGAKEATSLPVFATVALDERGKLLTGGDIDCVVALLEGLRVDALGLNCSFGPDLMIKLMPRLMEATSLPVIIMPNAGLPQYREGEVVYDIDPAGFAGFMREIALGGAWMLGGCCGTTPAHIRAMAEACKDIVPLPIQAKNRTVVSSYAKAAIFGERPMIIGERINPTGKKRLQQALAEGDMDYILDEGIKQQDAGADILDVNVGMPGLDEPALMKTVISQLQSITNLPLQADTGNLEAMEAALRIYNGKALINSVNGKQEVMNTIFPLVKKYGGVVIALTLDENGIPDTAQGRLDIARRIIKEAQKYGIPKHDIVADALAMTISAGQYNGAVTLETLSLLQEEGIRTSLGVSNVSFGLPQRGLVNAGFLSMAIQNGLGAAIINPGAEAMMDAYYAACALTGQDAGCGRYIARFSGEQSAPPTHPEAAMGLDDAIVRGLKDGAHRGAENALKTTAPLDVIEGLIVPALDRVGKAFESGKMFLPQLLMSAEAAKEAFEVIRGQMGAATELAGEKIVLATVQGDIHDIGKNIVKVLLENYGYQVIDLGKDVPPEAVVEATLRHEVKLVGLSALMTTTVAKMEETIMCLRHAAPMVRIMVGGAVLTPEYAKQMGADYYAKDAMGSVHIAKGVFSEECADLKSR